MQISNKSPQYVGFSRNEKAPTENNNTWTKETDRWSDAPPVLGDNGDVFVTGIQHRLYNLNLETGALNWQTDAGDQLYSPPVKATDETLVVKSHAHGAAREMLIGIDTVDGEVKWTHKQNQWGQMKIAGETGYSLLEAGFSSIDIDTGALNWSIPVESDARSEPVIGPKGRVYICEDEPTHGLRHFSKLNSETGEKEWGIFADDSAVSFSPEGLLGVKHHKYGDDFEPIANQFDVRSPETGEKLWSLDRMGLNYFTQFAGDGSLLMGSYKDYSDAHHTLESRDASTGDLNWSTQLPPFGQFETSSNNLLVGRTTKQQLQTGERYGHDFIALDPATGEKVWNFEPQIDEWQGVHVKENGLYLSGRRNIGDTDRYRSILFAIDQETGEKKWEYDAGLDHRQVLEDPAAGRLYVSVGENKLVCLDADTGSPLWHVKSDIAIEVSDELTNDGRVLIADLNGNVAAISQDSPLAIPGDVPQDPDKDHGIPTATRGYSAQHMMEGSKEILGEQRDVILNDPENDGIAEGWEAVLIQDTNADGQYTNEDLEVLPSRAFLESLDSDGNGILVGTELASQSLTWWGDREKDGVIGEDDYFRDNEERLIDLERLHETVRY